MTKKNSLKLLPFLGGRMLDYVFGATKDHQPTLSKFQYKLDAEGDYVRGPNGAYVRGEPLLGEWRPNDPFEARFEWVDFYSARAAGRVWMKRIDTGELYPFFIHDVSDILANRTFARILPGQPLQIEATWIGVKKGANFGIQVYG